MVKTYKSGRYNHCIFSEAVAPGERKVLYHAVKTHERQKIRLCILKSMYFLRDWDLEAMRLN